MMHYSETPESNTELKPEGFLLVDSGGHYYEGTTDITRTFVLGPISDEMKQQFTAVCRSKMKHANAKFLYGACGLNLDILARGPLWDMGIDYKCGTGHGVGYILNVHEGPNGFRWKNIPDYPAPILEEGMLTSDEPGYYLEGEFGIRHENLVLCRKAEKTSFGQFMRFETLTMVPFDLEGIDPKRMSDHERKLLNDYHRKVYETITPYLNEDEKEKFQLEGNRIWLKLTCVHVKNCFLLYSTAGKDSGFTLTDSKGNVEILHIRGNRENKNHLYLELAREVEDEAELSFAWQADPIKHPPVDEVTFLPLLSFYKSHINLTINKEFRLDVK